MAIVFASARSIRYHPYYYQCHLPSCIVSFGSLQILTKVSINPLQKSEVWPSVLKRMKKQAISLTQLSLLWLGDGGIDSTRCKHVAKFSIGTYQARSCRGLSHILIGKLGSGLMPSTPNSYAFGFECSFKSRFNDETQSLSGEDFSHPFFIGLQLSIIRERLPRKAENT